MKRIFILILFFLTLGNVLFAKEPSSGVILSEIMWGRDKDGEEWIELKNIKEGSINLSGWSIDNAGRDGKTIDIESGVIPSKGRFLICAKESKKDFCDIYTSISLANNYQSNGRLVLRNKNEIMDLMPIPKDNNWPAGKSEGVSMKRVFLDGEDPKSWQDNDPPGPEGSGILLSANAGSSIISLVGKEIIFNASKSTGNINNFVWNFGDGTVAEGEKVAHRYDFPGKYIVSLIVSNGRNQEKDTISVTIYPDTIFISEFSPREEWIEIVNESNYIQNISGWGISNKKDKIVFKFPENSFIAANSFILLPSNLVSSAILKNGGSLFLFYPLEDVRQQINYNGYDGSIARKGSEYFYTDTKTPGTENIISGDSNDDIFGESVETFSSRVVSPTSFEDDKKPTKESNIDKKGISQQVENVKFPSENGKITVKDFLAEVKNTKGNMFTAVASVTLFSGIFGLGLVKLRRRLKTKPLSNKIQVEIED